MKIFPIRLSSQKISCEKHWAPNIFLFSCHNIFVLGATVSWKVFVDDCLDISFMEGLYTKFIESSINRATEIPRSYYRILNENLPNSLLNSFPSTQNRIST